jgi:predicted nucleotide-binding protein (sugar kinase/HSP70/actin superfamily)
MDHTLEKLPVSLTQDKASPMQTTVKSVGIDSNENTQKNTTLLFNGATWKHDYLIEGMFQNLGYQCRALPIPTVDSFQIGKEFGNNGQCNPTYFTVGNLVKFLKELESQGMSRKEITDQYAFFTFGANGPCRFGMYVEEYRLALRNAGFPDFRIEIVDRDAGLNQDESNALVDCNLDVVFGLLNGFNLGDIITSVGYQIRPYEINPGETDQVTKECMEKLYQFMRNRPPYEIKHFPKTIKRHFPSLYEGICYLGKFMHQIGDNGFKKTLEHCRERFDSIQIDRTRVKPTVKITGEFWAQTTEGDGNFNMFKFLEQEGSQCIVEPVATWVPYLLLLVRQNAEADRTAHGPSSELLAQKLKRKARQQWEYWMTSIQLKIGLRIFLREYDRLARVFGDLSTYLLDQDKLADLGGEFYNTHADGGEGHLEIAKAIYYSTHDKAHMILSVKPFGCMPSTQSDGAMTQVMSKYKDMIFLPIETSGEGEVNAHSRVQMALGEAKHKAKAEFSQIMEQTGHTMEQIHAYIADHPELKTPMYPVPHYKEVVGTAANFVKHVAERMYREGIPKKEVPREKIYG